MPVSFIFKATSILENLAILFKLLRVSGYEFRVIILQLNIEYSLLKINQVKISNTQ